MEVKMLHLSKKNKEIFGLLIIVIIIIISVITINKIVFKKNVSLQSEIQKASPKNVMVFAHRGMLYHNPEHSFAGYNENIKDGATIIEQDVHMTKDKYLIVSHDDNLMRTTGKNISISHSNYDQIKNIRLRNEEKVHTLDEVLAKYKTTVNYAIEAKREFQHNFELEHLIAKDVNKHGLTKNVLIQDANLNGLISIHKEINFKNVPTLWLENDNHFKTDYKKTIDQAPQYITFISMPLNLAKPEIVNYIHQNKHLVNVWTITNYDDNAAAKAARVDSVFTNDAKFTLHYLKHSF